MTYIAEYTFTFLLFALPIFLGYCAGTVTGSQLKHMIEDAENE